MPSKIDIDALKIFTKSRTNETEYRQKIKNSQIYRCLKGRVYFEFLTFKKFWKLKT